MNNRICLELIFESGPLTVNLTLFDPDDFIKTLYIDQYFYESDEEITESTQVHNIGCISAEDSSISPIQSQFFNSLITQHLIFRALDNKSANFFYILHQILNDQSKVLLIKVPFSSLHPDFSYIYSLSSARSSEISDQFNFTQWVESYKLNLAQWVNFSAAQKTKILSLTQDLQSIINKDQDPKKSLKSFGECLLCYERSRNIVFLPCGHLVACIQCSVCKLKVEINDDPSKTGPFPACPICKQDVKNAIETTT